MFLNVNDSTIINDIFSSKTSTKITLIICALLLFVLFIFLHFSKKEIYSILYVIILGVLNIFFILLCITTFKHNIDNSDQIENIDANISGTIKEYPQNILDNYIEVTESYKRLINKQLAEGGKIESNDLDEIQNQIDELTNNVININDKIDKLSNKIEDNYDSNIISSIITGFCGIMSSVITANSVIKVIVYKIQNENKRKKHKR